MTVKSNKFSSLHSRLSLITDDIAAFTKITDDADIHCKGDEQIYRKAYFLERVAAELPTVLFEDERIVGSMRIWNVRKTPGYFARRKFMNQGHIAVDYHFILSKGISGIREYVNEHRGKDSPSFLRSLDAFSLFIRRYGEAAKEKGMDVVAANCLHLCENPPKSFHQALQLVWFVHLFLHVEGMEAGVSFGRFDMYMYPFYKNDIASGRITREEAKELLSHFWYKTNEGDESQNLTVGGNAENELSFLCIEVTGELCLPQPSLSVRYGSATSARFKGAVNDLIRKSIGMPSIFNDTTVIRSLEYLGIPKDDAEDYSVIGCYETNPGNALGLTVAGSVRLHEIMLAFLADNPDPYCDFDKFYEAFGKYLSDYYINTIIPQFQRRWNWIQDESASPFESVCIRSCIESGTTAEYCGAKYTMFGVNLLGIGTLVDSIYVMKKVVFEDRLISYKDFTAQVLAGFQNEEIAMHCRNMPGKYGTDSDETNKLASELSKAIAELVKNNPVVENVITYPGLFIFYGDIYSQNYPATPDGRRSGERISYGIAPSDICKGTSITSIINSASCIANDKCACGNPLLMFVPTGDDDTLNTLIDTYFERGGFHLHINLASAESMRAAKLEPSAWQDLTVRTSGYSARFVALDETLQNALIERARR